jgi:hypothetical protein
LIVVGRKDNLQEAINRAVPGDTIVLEAGSVFTGSFLLPKKSGESYITIQTSRIAELPENVRVGPGQAALFAKLQTTGSKPVIETESGSHHYKFAGIEFSASAPDVRTYELIRFGLTGKPQSDLASVPNNLVIDRCYIHGFPTQEIQRGISVNSATTQITNSYISDIHGIGYDSQAICGWNGPGPFLIVNNYLEAAGENLMFGGAGPTIPNLIPSDIKIRRNTFFKPLSWKVGDPGYAGIHWTVKNLLELKMARNVVIDGNTFENSWVDGQAGYAVLFTVRNQTGNAPWAILENVSFTNNTVKNSQSGIQTLGSDYNHPSQQSTGLIIANNVFDGISHWFITVNGYNNVTVEHNTHFQRSNIITLTGPQSQGFIYRNNLTVRNPYGVYGDKTGEGNVGLTKFVPDNVFAGNVVAGADSARYPTGNFYPATLTDIQSYRLTASSRFKGKATDGKDPGVNMDALLAAQSQ